MDKLHTTLGPDGKPKEAPEIKVPANILVGSLESVDREFNTELAERFQDDLDLGGKALWVSLADAYMEVMRFPANQQKEAWINKVDLVFDTDLLEEYYVKNPLERGKSKIDPEDREAHKPSLVETHYESAAEQCEEQKEAYLKELATRKICCVCEKEEFYGWSQQNMVDAGFDEGKITDLMSNNAPANKFRQQVWSEDGDDTMYTFAWCSDECEALLQICTPVAYKKNMVLIQSTVGDDVEQEFLL